MLAYASKVSNLRVELCPVSHNCPKVYAITI
jgi:hypothetical protein